MRPEFAAEIEDLMTRQQCPITLDTSAELGHENRFVSAIDKGQVYSPEALRKALVSEGSKRLRQGQQPIYISPLTRQDMTAEAHKLGLPALEQGQGSETEWRQVARIVIGRDEDRPLAKVPVAMGVATGLAMIGLGVSISQTAAVRVDAFCQGLVIGGGCLMAPLVGLTTFVIADLLWRRQSADASRTVTIELMDYIPAARR